MNDITVITGRGRRKVLDYLEERFGIDKNIFNDYVFVKKGKKIWITNNDVVSRKYKDIPIESIGMVFIRLQKNGMKITTSTAQIFGKHAKKNVIQLSKTQAHDVLQGFNLQNIQTNAEDGYVIMKYSDYVLGIGLKRGSFIMNMIPKARIIRIESI
jgi:NOL1/NOP2/fmu family ribosome biogenesis protein